MTNKEVIKRLEWARKRICDITYSPESFEAISIAIEKLREERPQGEWIIKPKENSQSALLICNKCKHFIPITVDKNFCPNCGADMRKENIQ